MGGDAYWFSHDSNARDDPRCALLIDQLGLEGYGIYWVLIETLRDQPGYRYPLRLLPVLARRYNTTAEKARVVVGNYGLFTVVADDDEFFLSPALCRRMERWDEKRELARSAGVQSGVKRRLAAASRTGVERPLNASSTSVERQLNAGLTTDQRPLNIQQNRTLDNSIEQHTTTVAVDNSNDVLTRMTTIIGTDAAQRWISDPNGGADYCEAQLALMDRQRDTIRNQRQWLLSALQHNWANWKPPAPRPDPNCPNCGGQGVVVDLEANITTTCSCVQAQLHLPRQQLLASSTPTASSDHDPDALAVAVAAKWQS